ncbi:hypothetical protein ACH5RR_018261 [Cinchona calisaya]|uniref:Uncharacterized protein n=1 Tax=Cinchona calisaya TaxID=153742 RepID=A0ABD2ZPN0_9GENT
MTENWISMMLIFGVRGSGDLARVVVKGDGSNGGEGSAMEEEGLGRMVAGGCCLGGGAAAGGGVRDKGRRY